MEQFFVEDKWYLLNEDARKSFIEQAPGVNNLIANYLSGKPFQVEFTDEGDVSGIRFSEDEAFISRTEAIPSKSGTEYGFYWFYEEDDTEYEYFDEVEAPVQGKVCIIVLTEDDSGSDSYWNGTRHCIGGANPTMFTMAEAKEHVENFLNETTDVRAKAEIFVLKTTAQLVKEIKFS